MKKKIYWRLTLLRDKPWIISPITEIIDWIRYEWLYDYEKEN